MKTMMKALMAAAAIAVSVILSEAIVKGFCLLFLALYSPETIETLHL